MDDADCDEDRTNCKATANVKIIPDIAFCQHPINRAEGKLCPYLVQKKRIFCWKS
ncbi:hypothetical protein K420107F6_30590 [Lactonifactor longoviformis]